MCVVLRCALYDCINKSNNKYLFVGNQLLQLCNLWASLLVCVDKRMQGSTRFHVLIMLVILRIELLKAPTLCCTLPFLRSFWGCARNGFGVDSCQRISRISLVFATVSATFLCLTVKKHGCISILCLGGRRPRRKDLEYQKVRAIEMSLFVRYSLIYWISCIYNASFQIIFQWNVCDVQLHKLQRELLWIQFADFFHVLRRRVHFLQIPHSEWQQRQVLHLSRQWDLLLQYLPAI